MDSATTGGNVFARLRIWLEQFDDEAPAHEVYGPYINAPVWPWLWAGTIAGLALVLMFIVAWLFARG